MLNARLAIAAASILSLVPLRAQDDDGEFSAHGVNVIRIENEAKLRVPNEIVEDVWNWLRNRYGDCSWLDRDGAKFTAAFGDGVSNGTTAEDRFFGWSDPNGILAIGIPSGTFEVDHLQYGVAVPEPTTIEILGLGIALVGWFGCRRGRGPLLRDPRCR